MTKIFVNIKKSINFEIVHLAALCIYYTHTLIMGHPVTQLVEVLRYKS
jgi:hypothetical protein